MAVASLEQTYVNHFQIFRDWAQNGQSPDGTLEKLKFQKKAEFAARAQEIFYRLIPSYPPFCFEDTLNPVMAETHLIAQMSGKRTIRAGFSLEKKFSKSPSNA